MGHLKRRATWVLTCSVFVSTVACVGTSVPGANALGVDPTDPRPPVEVKDGEGPLTPFVPAPLQTRVLLSWQYRNAVEDLLGPEAAAAVTAPVDSPVGGFDAIGSAQLALSPRAVSQYEVSAHAAAAAALETPARRTALYGCSPESTTDAECFRTFLSRIGRRAFRRSLAAEELEAWVKLGQEAATAFSSFDRGAEFALSSLLQAPSFLYVVEEGVPDPLDNSRLRLTGTELATRLSLFLTGSLPDEALLDAAEAGALDTGEGIRTHARQLLQSPRARAALARFFDELLHLRDMDHLSKGTQFTLFTPALAAAMHQETQLFLEQLIFEQGDFRELLSAPHTYVNAELASFYGLPPPEGTGFARVELPESSGRAGILGHASYLALNAHAVVTSPTYRGKFIRERILCHTMPAPPPDVDTSSINKPVTTPMTMRQRLSEHQQNPACAGCHTLMDNLGLAMEHFDAIGRYRPDDNGLPLDTVMSAPDVGTFSSPRELGLLLRDDPRVLKCLTKNLFRAAAGHVETSGESTPLREAQQRFVNGGHDLKELLVELVSSAAFRYAVVNP